MQSKPPHLKQGHDLRDCPICQVMGKFGRCLSLQIQTETRTRTNMGFVIYLPISGKEPARMVPIPDVALSRHRTG